MPRQVFNLNRDWRFFRGDIPGAEAIDYDDRSWQRIGLPHTFDLPYFRTPEFYVGFGWYRRRLVIPDALPSHRYFIEFDGVFQVAEIFVNGTCTGQHRGGYTGFSIDITAAMRQGENILAIRVNNNWDAQLAPRAGEHIFSGGIYRDVRLVETGMIRVAWCGTAITTPRISADAATIHVRTEIDCEQLDGDGPIRHGVFAPDGTPVAEGEGYDAAITIQQPLLWHPDHPHLYTLRQELFADGRLTDVVETRFGIRHFEWTPDRGFFLNGEHLYLRGANAHQDHAGWGIGITRAAAERDVRLIKQAGFNFVRGAHYPHHPAFAEACDRLGLLFWSEATFWGKGGFGPEGYWNASAYPVNDQDFEGFEQSCLDQLDEMIRINRNHPSIIAWSMTNEAFFTYNLDRAKELMRKMVARSRELDPTRPAAIGGAQRGDIDRIGDIAGYNGDGARLFIDSGVPNVVSEYGAISKPHDAFDPFFGEKQKEHFPWRAGEAIWCGFDYGSIAGRQGLKGILDHQRLPKQSWHWYRQHNLNITPPAPPGDGEPFALKLEADKTTIGGTDATSDAQIIVTVVDRDGNHVNQNPPVTLTIESGPGEFPTGRVISFDDSADNRIVRGMCATALRSYHGGETLIRATSVGLQDATITITTSGEPRWVEGVSPQVELRPYAPPILSEAAKRAMANVVNVALNRPSNASSEKQHHPARLGNDGTDSTFWESNESGGWWQVDLEGFYQISGSKIIFPIEGNWRFFVEISEDGVNWTLAVDRRDTINRSAVRNDIYPPGATARYWRIALASTPNVAPQLAEVEVYGVLSTR